MSEIVNEKLGKSGQDSERARSLVNSMLFLTEEGEEDNDCEENVEDNDEDEDEDSDEDEPSRSSQRQGRHRDRSRSPGRSRDLNRHSVKFEPFDQKDVLSSNDKIEAEGTNKPNNRNVHGNKNKTHEKREGDWTCPSCSANCFKDRLFCFKCRIPKPGSFVAGSSTRPGDWPCMQCQAMNFAKRNTCFKCGVYRPQQPMYGMAVYQQSKPYSAYGVHPLNPYPDAGNQSAIGNYTSSNRSWICRVCNANVFGNRNECFKCKTAKFTNVGASGNYGVKSIPNFGQFPHPQIMYAPQGGQSSNMRPGDWMCPGCSKHNYASRSQCFRCKMERPPYMHGGMMSPMNMQMGMGMGMGMGFPQPGMVDMMNSRGPGGVQQIQKPRAGDWTCGKCKSSCFASRDSCFKCSAPRNEGTPVNVNDWVCGECNARVFGSRSECFKCKAPKS